MSKQASLLVLAAFGLAAVLYFTLRTDPTAHEFDTDDPAGVSGIESQAQAAEPDEGNEAVVRLSSTQVMGADAEGRAEVAAGHRIQVLFADGSPAAGMRVQTFIPEVSHATEILAFWREHSTEILWWNDKLEYTLADADGFVRLPTYSRAVVSVASEFGVGHIVCDSVDPSAAADALVLQLRTVPMIEVQVLDASGASVESGYHINAHVAESGKENSVSFTARRIGVGPAWKRHGGVGKLDDGRRMLSLAIGSYTEAMLGQIDEALRYRLTVSGGFSEFQPREFGASEPGPIVFQFPEQGSLALQLKGYPDDAIPYLRLVGEFDRHVGEQAGELSEVGQWFHFEGLPVGREFELRIYTRAAKSDPDGRHARTSLTGPVISGPTLAGERVEHIIGFEPPPGLHGRFLIPDGLTIPVDEFVAFANRVNLGARVYYGEGRPKVEAASCSVFADGRFFIPLERLQRRSAQPHELSTLMLQWVQPMPSSWDDSEPWIPARLWASRELSLDSYAAAVDLGEIQLMHEGPLMRVRVTGPDGEPVSNARVEVAARSAAEPGSHAYRGSSLNLPPTDGLGEAWILGQDWYSTLRFPGPQRSAIAQPHEQLLAVRFLAKHASLAESSVILPASELDQSTIEIRMLPAGSIHGSVNFLHDLDGVDLIALPPGSTDLEDWHQTGVDPQRIEMLDRSDFEPRKFVIDAVPPGEWDLVFSVPNQAELVLLRVPRVLVIAGEECHDPRLQNIELGSALGFLRFRFRDGFGRILSRETTDAFQPAVWFIEKDGRSATGRGADWTGDQLVYPLPTGETASITFEAEGWETKIFTDVSAQDFEVTVRRIPLRKLAIQGLAELPEGMVLGVSLNKAGDFFGSGVWNSGQPGPAQIQLKSAGDFSVNWWLRADDKQLAHGSTHLTVTESELFSDAPLELEVPEQIKEHLSPN